MTTTAMPTGTATGMRMVKCRATPRRRPERTHNTATATAKAMRMHPPA